MACRGAGLRVGPHIKALIPALCRFISDVNRLSEDIEIRDLSLQALRFLLLSCPREMNKFVPRILEIADQFLNYDPNLLTASREIDMDETGEGDNMEVDECGVGVGGFSDDDGDGVECGAGGFSDDEENFFSDDEDGYGTAAM